MSPEDRNERSAGALAEEDTLRMIAMLAAPEGLEDRVKAGLRSAPRRGAVIAWPSASGEGWMHSAGMRAAAAAAIVLAVAGGGWGVYSHIQIAPVPSAFVEQPLQNGAGRFSTAGAMHVPKTVQGPVVAAPVVEKQKQEAGKASQKPERQAGKKSKARANAALSADQPSSDK
ncbi:MAG TPA: hypothetical protein VL135_03045 [Terracidiphilus sp.]|nr:hypothetical protein [Terracidiphilus sp.]